MTFRPSITELAARARADLRMGLPVVLSGADGAALVLATETLSPERLQQVRELPGETVLVITARRAGTLKARAYDGDLARIPLPPTADIAWVQAVADPADDLVHPMKGPLLALRRGDSMLARLALGLLKSARLLPAAVVTGFADGAEFAGAQGLTLLRAEALRDTLGISSPLHEIVSASVPLAVSEAGRVHVFRPEDGSEEHYAIEIGKPVRGAPVLTRLHSACFTGDLLGSLKCDCGAQLRTALAQMGQEGSGMLLYLSQEGRGIGLANKMRAYSLQDQGFDTVEANHRLGFEDDERDFRIGANILKAMGFGAVRLLTNNPRKVEMMEKAGVRVAERVPLRVGETPENKTYLATKARKSGHFL